MPPACAVSCSDTASFPPTLTADLTDVFPHPYVQAVFTPDATGIAARTEGLLPHDFLPAAVQHLDAWVALPLQHQSALILCRPPLHLRTQLAWCFACRPNLAFKGMLLGTGKAHDLSWACIMLLSNCHTCRSGTWCSLCSVAHAHVSRALCLPCVGLDQTSSCLHTRPGSSGARCHKTPCMNTGVWNVSMHWKPTSGARSMLISAPSLLGRNTVSANNAKYVHRTTVEPAATDAHNTHLRTPAASCCARTSRRFLPTGQSCCARSACTRASTQDVCCWSGMPPECCLGQWDWLLPDATRRVPRRL